MAFVNVENVFAAQDLQETIASDARTVLQSVKFSTIVLNALDLTRDFTIRAYVIKDVRMLRSFLFYRKHHLVKT